MQVDGGQLKGHDAGFDGSQIEDIADYRHQLPRGIADAFAVFPLAGVEGAEIFFRQDFRKADDSSQRRADFVRDIGDKLRFKPVGHLQGLGPFAQRQFDPHAVGNVQIGQQDGAVGQGHVGVIDDPAVAAKQSPAAGLPGEHAGDDFLFVGRPVVDGDQQRLHDLNEIGKMQGIAEPRFVDTPEMGKHWVEQLQAAVAAEHGDPFVQVVERLALDGIQRIVGPLKGQPVGDVFIGKQQTAQGVGADDAA